MKRCEWPGENPLQIDYHDTEWGTPVHDERALFEFITLEGAQAGLSWDTILRKRDGYRRIFAGFDPEKVARFNTRSVERLMLDPGIVRNRAKIESTISNARAVLELRDEGGLDAFLWSVLPDGRPIQNRWRSLSDLPPETAESRAMSRELKAKGFRFVGPTTMYAFMQAAGLVNDHVTSCFRWEELGGSGAAGQKPEA
jgi:DNA-3-methyladenine glycosylase I